MNVINFSEIKFYERNSLNRTVIILNGENVDYIVNRNTGRLKYIFKDIDVNNAGLLFIY